MTLRQMTFAVFLFAIGAISPATACEGPYDIGAAIRDADVVLVGYVSGERGEGWEELVLQGGDPGMRSMWSTRKSASW